MAIGFICPTCGKQHTVGDEQAGRQAKCTCGTVLLIPAAPAQPIRPAPAPAVGPVLSAELGPAVAPQPYVPSAAPVQAYSTPGYMAPAPAWGASPPGRAAKAEESLRNIIALIAIGYGAYYTYAIGFLIYWQRSYWALFFRQLPLLFAELALIALGFVILMRVRGTGLWGFILGLVVIALTAIDLIFEFADIVQGSHFAPVGGFALGNAFVGFLFTAVFRLGCPGLITWWSRVLNYEPQW